MRAKSTTLQFDSREFQSRLKRVIAQSVKLLCGEGYLTIKDVSDITGLSRYQIIQGIKSGKFPPNIERINDQCGYRFRSSDINEYMRRHQWKDDGGREEGEQCRI